MRHELTLSQALSGIAAGAFAVGALASAVLLLFDDASLWRAAAFALGGLCLWLWSAARLLRPTQ